MNNLKKLRNEKKLTQEEIGKFLNISSTGYASWEKLRTEPDIKTLIKLADFYGVSIDYLVGRANEDEIVKIINDTSSDEDYLLDILRQLPALEKEVIYKFAELTLKQYKEDKQKK